jgi:hypothetical protein
MDQFEVSVFRVGGFISDRVVFQKILGNLLTRLKHAAGQKIHH